MIIKKNLPVILAVMGIFLLSACGSDKISERTDSVTNTATPTATDIPEQPPTDAPGNNNDNIDHVSVYYGWDINDTDCIVDIYCPKEAKFNVDTLETQERDGRTPFAYLIDETNEYVAMSNCYLQRHAYTNDSPAYPIVAQLYFEGNVDDTTAKDYTDYSQEITPLGFQWEGRDVILIKTAYTYQGEPSQMELFAGVEYDLYYQSTDSNTGESIPLTTKGLIGFDMYSYSLDDLTQEQCAWIIGQLFGIDSGVEYPFSQRVTKQ